MQNHEYFYPEKFALPLAPEAADTYLHAPLVSALDAVLPSGVKEATARAQTRESQCALTSFERVELQPSEVCPKNFIIFDQTDNQSRIMFHPAMANKFSGPGLNGLNVHATYNRETEKNKANPVEGELSSPFEEDSKDIDALLSLEEEELEDYDEEELSTARTNENYENICDTCSSYGSKSKKRSSSSVRKSSKTHGHCSNPEIKQWEMKRMIRVLRGIVPGGGDQMDSVAVLDEAVRYLKSLKVEAEKLGVAL